MDSNKINVNRVINYNKIRYSRLLVLINTQYSGSNADTINLYIDLYSIFKPLYSSNVYIDDYLELTSSIINLCGYYRFFFRKNYNVHTRIYLVYSSNIPSGNIMIYPEYNKKTISTISTTNHMIQYISNTLDLLTTICPYIPDIQFCMDYAETGVIIEYIKSFQVNYIPNIVLSRDAYNYQLVDDNTIILRPHKTVSSQSGLIDESIIINRYNAIKEYCKVNGVLLADDNISIDGSYLPVFMAISRCPQRNIKSINKIPKALSMLQDADLINIVRTDRVLATRYYVCDIKQQLSSYKVSAYRNITNGDIENLYNKEEIQNLNNKYFSKYPLELESL